MTPAYNPFGLYCNHCHLKVLCMTYDYDFIVLFMTYDYDTIVYNNHDSKVLKMTIDSIVHCMTHAYD